MGRAVEEARITTPNARAKLASRKAPYWRAIDTGLHIGYRKGVDGGSWVGRLRLPDGTYRTEALGRADDNLDAHAGRVLSYSDALKRVEHWRLELVTPPVEAAAPVAPYTVSDAARDYLVWFEAHRKSYRQTKQAIDAHILPALGSKAVAGLTSAEIREWHTARSKLAARVRSRKGVRYRETTDDPDQRRKRRASTNRVMTILKAMLNHAFEEGRVPSDEAWRRVKPFRSVDLPRVRYLTETECGRLIAACPSDFRALVRAALLTGCRYGELAALRVDDFDQTGATIRVRESKSGKSRHVDLNGAGVALFRGLAAGKARDALLLAHEGGDGWAKSHQSRRLADACEIAEIVPPISFHELRHTYASHLAMRGVSLQVIAAELGHSDTRMTERHYAHLSKSYVATQVQQNLPEFTVAHAAPPEGSPPLGS